MHILKNHRKLLRILLQAEDSNFNLIQETSTKATQLGFVPIMSIHQFGSRSRRKDYLHRYGRRRANSARNCSHVTAWARS